MESALENLRVDIATCEQIENNLRGRPATAVAKPRNAPKGGSKDSVNGHAQQPMKGVVQTRDVDDVLAECISACKQSRKRHREENQTPNLLDDTSLSQFTRFTDQIALDPYKQFLHYVPRLVNIVTVKRMASNATCSATKARMTHDTGSNSKSIPRSIPRSVSRSQLAEALPMAGSGLTLPLNLSMIASCCKGSFYAPRRFAAVCAYRLKLEYTPSDRRCFDAVFFCV